MASTSGASTIDFSEVGVTDPLFRTLTGMGVVFTVAVLVLLFGALADIITIDGSRMKHLPRIWWIIIVILMPLIGSALWFSVGRTYVSGPSRGNAGGARAGRTADLGSTSGRDYAVRDAETELAALDREIAAHQRDERISKLEAELESKREARRRQDRPDNSGQ